MKIKMTLKELKHIIDNELGFLNEDVDQTEQNEVDDVFHRILGTVSTEFADGKIPSNISGGGDEMEAFYKKLDRVGLDDNELNQVKSDYTTLVGAGHMLRTIGKETGPLTKDIISKVTNELEMGFFDMQNNVGDIGVKYARSKVKRAKSKRKAMDQADKKAEQIAKLAKQIKGEQ